MQRLEIRRWLAALFSCVALWRSVVAEGISPPDESRYALGTMIKFILFPVTMGFTSGIAVVTFSAQVKDFLGLQIPVAFVKKLGGGAAGHRPRRRAAGEAHPAGPPERSAW